MKYLFIEKHAVHYPVRQLCQALGVSHSGYYAWHKRQVRPEDPHLTALLEHIERIHRLSRRYLETATTGTASLPDHR